jgi:hypothetical protein
MAPQVGLEPTTLRLTAGCSAIELLRSVSPGADGPASAIDFHHSIRHAVMKTVSGDVIAVRDRKSQPLVEEVLDQALVFPTWKPERKSIYVSRRGGRSLP